MGGEGRGGAVEGGEVALRSRVRKCGRGEGSGWVLFHSPSTAPFLFLLGVVYVSGSVEVYA